MSLEAKRRGLDNLQVMSLWAHKERPADFDFSTIVCGTNRCLVGYMPRMFPEEGFLELSDGLGSVLAPDRRPIMAYIPEFFCINPDDLTYLFIPYRKGVNLENRLHFSASLDTVLARLDRFIEERAEELGVILK